MSILYNRIETLCKNTGISITTMCKESGASRASLSDLKVGRKQTLSAATLDKIADYFDTTVDYLLGRTDDLENSDRFVTMHKYGGVFMGNLYNNIISLCEERGIKGGKMCTDLGFSKSLLTDLKAGRKKNITSETALKIANYFQVSVARVIGEEKEKPTAEGSELDKQLEGVDFALYGEVKDLTEAQKRDVLRFIQFLKQEE